MTFRCMPSYDASAQWIVCMRAQLKFAVKFAVSDPINVLGINGLHINKSL
ncbi:hypothetical protein Bhyg_04717 [Pseudolycoriella hygida]|uniref:Uncharacterized protein n=1 Tax=Pseudolycoriella hygida TaxID=35572 RepID=A0A9Q0NFR9_9DIPT|nr:hypothetical protein Bhyg_04717 [Pseudolycoriella hygida]